MPQLWVGTRKGLFRITDDHGSWRVADGHFLGTQVPMLLPLGGGRVLAALKHGHFGPKLQWTEDDGRHWRELETPVYPPKPDSVPDVIDPMRNKAIEWSLDMIWALEAGGERIWCGTLPGGLFCSEDQGASWELNMPLWSLPNRSHWFGGGYDLPGIHSICIDPRNSDWITVAISCGGVWRSEDGGGTWECRSEGMRAEYMPPDREYDPDIQDPHRMVQCSGSPACYWVQHHNGIFRSRDDCRSWQEIDAPQPSGFGFGVAVHPSNPEVAWFVPAVRDADRYPVNGEFVVTRTQDGGRSFEVLRAGLPQQHAYHLVYRHALEFEPEKATLAMGSTTGGLWTSRDLGDSWEAVSRDLPPIYAVRFDT